MNSRGMPVPPKATPRQWRAQFPFSRGSTRGAAGTRVRVRAEWRARNVLAKEVHVPVFSHQSRSKRSIPCSRDACVALQEAATSCHSGRRPQPPCVRRRRRRSYGKTEVVLATNGRLARSPLRSPLPAYQDRGPEAFATPPRQLRILPVSARRIRSWRCGVAKLSPCPKTTVSRASH